MTVKSSLTVERERSYKPILRAIVAERDLLDFGSDGDIAAPGKMVEVGTLDDRAMVYLARDLLRTLDRTSGVDDFVAAALVLLERETRDDDAYARERETQREQTRQRRAEQARKNFGHKR